jgi:hypothetical protein
MGFVQKLVGGVLGGSQPKAAPAAAPVQTKPTGPSAEDIAAAEADKQRKARLALNAGDSAPATLGGVSGNANVTRRNLLGM